MTGKNKFKYYFLLISTFGLIKLRWKKYRQTEVKNKLTVKEQIDFDINELIQFLGGKDNITNTIATYSKIKISFKDKSLIQSKKIQTLNGVSGMVLQSQSITLVVGNNAKYIEQLLKEA
ncbi:PTS glucose transporter subunit IIB [Mycoplasma phocoenae]|uniref:PTS glucose transporter subunit IIB n=1 Tax=Mycoplasma phocoenae TaxID=754517 RepID=A0A858U7S7_9MOLU|nr:PTS glucose transporter subunit IIB [Mycoplasma phocoenae]QJG66828.1 PTS glucose transporter subunit IIB [Mycoplasma phocoenae]